jgi:hypothetical protein
MSNHFTMAERAGSENFHSAEEEPLYFKAYSIPFKYQLS